MYRDVDTFVLKAQTLSGKRGKGGGILFADRSTVSQEVEQFFGKDSEWSGGTMRS